MMPSAAAGAPRVEVSRLGSSAVGIWDDFDRLLTVEDAGIWKPAPAAYAYALEQCGVDPMDAMLVSVHPWDIDGASRAGLATAWSTGPAARTRSTSRPLTSGRSP